MLPETPNIRLIISACLIPVPEALNIDYYGHPGPRLYERLVWRLLEPVWFDGRKSGSGFESVFAQAPAATDNTRFNPWATDRGRNYHGDGLKG